MNGGVEEVGVCVLSFLFVLVFFSSVSFFFSWVFVWLIKKPNKKPTHLPYLINNSNSNSNDDNNDFLFRKQNKKKSSSFRI